MTLCRTILRARVNLVPDVALRWVRIVAAMQAKVDRMFHGLLGSAATCWQKAWSSSTRALKIDSTSKG
jgi:hypothetical protein